VSSTRVPIKRVPIPIACGVDVLDLNPAKAIGSITGLDDAHGVAIK
jgi:hypothetical protein